MVFCIPQRVELFVCTFGHLGAYLFVYGCRYNAWQQVVNGAVVNLLHRTLIKPNKRAPERMNFSTLEVFCIIH